MHKDWFKYNKKYDTNVCNKPKKGDVVLTPKNSNVRDWVETLNIQIIISFSVLKQFSSSKNKSIFSWNFGSKKTYFEGFNVGCMLPIKLFIKFVIIAYSWA